jgi:DNA-directed RNA polymerase subunit RPC12/RpoP
MTEEEERKAQEEERKAREEEEGILLENAKLAEKAGRYEDAAADYESLASIYESLKLYDKAREFRGIARRLKGKGKQVIVVDLNRLIQQVKEDGIVAIYRCPRCGGKLEIDKGTSVESLKVCKYCGSAIEAMDLADFLRTTLS